MSLPPAERRALPEYNLRYLRKKFRLRGLLESEPPRGAYLRVARLACEGLRELNEYTPTELEVRDWISAAIVNEDRFLRHIEAIDAPVLADTEAVEELATAAAGTVIEVVLQGQSSPEAPLC